MDQQQWKKINNIVDTALDLNEKERVTYIQQECKGDEQLKQQVTELIASIEQSDTENFLEDLGDYPLHLAQEISQKEIDENTSSLVGTTIDSYKLIELIGHGGMGSVFLAERADDAYTKKVALKLMREGMDTPSNIARFKRERNILANLNHPNIARLLDGGMTDEGLPYLVMEYVEGTPLYTYCDEDRLSLEKRLDLFKSICEAVQHAHNNAIIHRDLKPSNILVTEEGKIKILDFGIAKLLEPEDPDTKLFETQTGARILTLGYAAPEQVEHQAITTKTDIYTLGILLYELLAGVHPFDMVDKDFTAIEELIRHKIPSKPSARFQGLDTNQQCKTARLRKLSADNLINKLQGDLDAIVMKILRKEPEARYDAVTQLLEDLDRREQNRPIIARKDTFRYKTSKFFRRYKRELSTAAGILFIIAGIIFYYSWQITQERNKAKQEAKKAQQVSNFLVEIFDSGNPLESQDGTVTAEELLDKGIENVSQLTDRPVVQAEMLDAMGRAELGLGHYKKADSLLNKTLSIRRQLYNPPHPDIASSLTHRARVLRNMGDFATSESLARKAVEMQTIVHGEKHPKVAESLHELAFSLKEQSKFATAESLYRKALKIQQTVHKGPNEDIASTLTNLGQLLTERGEYTAADSIHHRALTMRRKLWRNAHPKIAESLNNLAQAREDQGYLGDAESLYRKALLIDKETLGPKHPKTAIDINNLAVVVERQGHLAEAESLKRRSLDLRREILGADHPDVTTAMNNLAVLLRKKEKYEEAESLFRQVLERLRGQFEVGHPYVAFTTGNLADVLREQGRYVTADSLYQSALRMIKNAFHDRHPHVATTLERLAQLRKDQNRYKEAEQYRRKALDIRRDAQGNQPETAKSLKDLADLLMLQGKADEAEQLYREALRINKNTLDKEEWNISSLKSDLGESLTKQGEYGEAESLLKEAVRSLKEKATNDHYKELTYQRLIDLYDSWNKPDLAATYRDTLSR